METYRYILPQSNLRMTRYSKLTPYIAPPIIAFYVYVLAFRSEEESRLLSMMNLLFAITSFALSIWSLQQSNQLFIELSPQKLSWRLDPYSRRRELPLLKLRQIHVGLMCATVTTVAGERHKIEFGDMPYATVQEVKAHLQAIATSPQLFTKAIPSV